MKKRMTIIIPTYNRADTLHKVLSKILSQHEILNVIEIIVVDDGSTDDTKECINQFLENPHVNIRYFYKQNTGAPAARNLGIKNAHGAILLFLDSDIIPSESLIPEHMKFHEKYTQDNFALRGSTKTSPEQSYSIRVMEIPTLEPKGSDSNYIELCWADFASGNISLKKTFLLQNGIFDEEVVVCEDWELGYRLGKRGLKLFHCNEAMGYHLHPVNLEQYLCWAETYAKSIAVWYSKTPDIRKDLLKIGKGYLFDFLTWKKPLLILKYFLRIAIISRCTVNLVIFLGNIFEKQHHDKLSRFCYRQAYQFYHRKAFRIHLKLIKKRSLRQVRN